MNENFKVNFNKIRNQGFFHTEPLSQHSSNPVTGVDSALRQWEVVGSKSSVKMRRHVCHVQAGNDLLNACLRGKSVPVNLCLSSSQPGIRQSMRSPSPWLAHSSVPHSSQTLLGSQAFLYLLASQTLILPHSPEKTFYFKTVWPHSIYLIIYSHFFHF